MADRYFLPHFPEGNLCELAGAEFHHLAHVLRAGPGDRLTLFDGQGVEADAEIVRLSKTAAFLRLSARRAETLDEDRQIMLATAVPKADRFRWLVEKATELGVDRLIPLHTGLSVVSPGEMKLQKMKQAVIEACKQSGRNRLMQIDPLTEWPELIASVAPSACTYVADPTGVPVSNLNGVRPKSGPVLLVVGPEGGLTETELRQAAAAGAHAIALGPRILRIETAALALAAIFALR